jgi:hypothetical protein
MALIGLNANVPQDSHTWSEPSPWIPRIDTHPPFCISQRAIPLVNNTNGYLGTKNTIKLKPTDCADLLTNMYLKFTLPAGNYTPHVGRAVIDLVELSIGNILIESISSEWYIVRDEILLNADQQIGLNKATGSTTGGLYIIPLDFFFCKKDHFFPMCALETSEIFVSLYFNTQGWITNTQNSIDLIDPQLIIEEVTLGPRERIYYMTTPLTYKIPMTYKEGVTEFINGVAISHISTTFPVSMIVWFIRNKLYESGDARYYQYRYSFGYTTKYIDSTIPVTFANGETSNYIDTIENVTLWLNNLNILKTFPDGLYHSVYQPVYHGLTVPSKNIYMQCFTEEPSKFQLDGTIDFSKYDYNTTHLDLTFNPTYSPDIQSNYSIYVFYYGFNTLRIENGECRVELI